MIHNARLCCAPAVRAPAPLRVQNVYTIMSKKDLDALIADVSKDMVADKKKEKEASGDI